MTLPPYSHSDTPAYRKCWLQCEYVESSTIKFALKRASNHFFNFGLPVALFRVKSLALFHRNTQLSEN
jgi:hypothetical protein